MGKRRWRLKRRPSDAKGGLAGPAPLPPSNGLRSLKAAAVFGRRDIELKPDPRFALTPNIVRQRDAGEVVGVLLAKPIKIAARPPAMRSRTVLGLTSNLNGRVESEPAIGRFRLHVGHPAPTGFGTNTYHFG